MRALLSCFANWALLRVRNQCAEHHIKCKYLLLGIDPHICNRDYQKVSRVTAIIMTDKPFQFHDSWYQGMRPAQVNQPSVLSKAWKILSVIYCS